MYLIETPSIAEGFNSNIRVLWIPDTKLKPGEPYRFDYTMHWSMEQPKYKVGIVTSTYLSAKPNNKNKQVSFTIYFDSHELQKLNYAAKVKAITTISSNARFLGEPQVIKDPYNKQWRVVLEVEPDLKPTSLPLVELSCRLLVNNKVVTETWSYRWRP